MTTYEQREFSELLRTLKKEGIDLRTIQTIDFYWEKLFEDRAFPKIKITFFNKK